MPGTAVDHLASYVPARLARQCTADAAVPTEPRAEHFSAAALFADVSGFTALAEQLARRGEAGAEELTSSLNIYFGQLIDLINGEGGDIIKFAGDALLALWPAADDDLATATARAARCALNAQARLHDFAATECARLSLRIGIGAGPVVILHVGGAHGRWEIVATGPALGQMGAAGKHAQPGGVTLSPEAWAIANGQVQGELFPDGAARVTGVRDDLAPAVVPPPPRCGRALLAYIPPAIVHHADRGDAGWLAELRRISVLFVNFPGLTAATPIERAEAVMGVLQEMLFQYEGTLNKLSVDDKGASLLAAFGLPPLGHEDDPLRAVRSALAIRERLRAMDVRHSIGVATGTAFCGVIGNDSRREYTMIGDVVNLSARLMQAADGGILTDRETRDDAAARMSFEELAPIHAKGKSEPVRVYRPTDGSASEAASTVAGALVDRTAEVRVVADAVRQVAKHGVCSTIVIEGEAGIGKSRLIAELVAQARAAGMTVLTAHGDAMEKATPYLPWRAIFYQAFELDARAAASERRDRVRDRVRGIGNQDWETLLPLLNPILLTDFPDTETTGAMDERMRAASTVSFLADLLIGTSAPGSRQAVVLDDVQWMDSSSWALASVVVGACAPQLMVLATRPLAGQAAEALESIVDTPGIAHLQLAPLGEADIIEIARQTLAASRLPEPIERIVRSRAEGNPLFAQELALALRDSGVIEIVGGECRLAPNADLGAIDVPVNMRAAVTSRIDRLAPSQRLTLKVASVVGRVFEAGVVKRVFPVGGADPRSIDADLRQLAALGILTHERDEPSPAWAFTHALFQDVTYHLMLVSQRRQLHRAVAEWLEETNAADLGASAALLAAHWSGAVEDDDNAEPALVWKAIDYLQKAGEQAMRQYANHEAVAFLNDALGLLEHVPEGPERTRRELAICCARGVPLIVLQGFAAPDVERTFARAWDLSKQTEYTPELFGAVLGLWNFSIVRTELQRARDLARELFRLAAAAADPELQLPANRAAGETAFWLGVITTAREHLQRAVALYRPELHARAAARVGQDPGVVCRGFLSWTLWLVGEPDAALAIMSDSLALARQLNHPFSVAMALQNFSVLHQFRGAPADAKKTTEEQIALSHDQGFALWLAGGTVMHGWARFELGETAAGLEEMRRGIADWRATGAELPAPYYLSLLAGALARAGDAAAALALVRDALAASAKSGEAWWRAELLRQDGELRLAVDPADTAAAQQSIREALELARRQGARALERRISP